MGISEDAITIAHPQNVPPGKQLAAAAPDARVHDQISGA